MTDSYLDSFHNPYSDSEDIHFDKLVSIDVLYDVYDPILVVISENDTVANLKIKIIRHSEYSTPLRDYSDKLSCVTLYKFNEHTGGEAERLSVQSSIKSLNLENDIVLVKVVEPMLRQTIKKNTRETLSRPHSTPVIPLNYPTATKPKLFHSLPSLNDFNKMKQGVITNLTASHNSKKRESLEMRNKRRRATVSNYDDSQLLYWLSESNLSSLIEIFSDLNDDDAERKTKMFSPHPNDSNMLLLTKASVDDLFELLLLSHHSPLNRVFEHKEFVLNLLLTYPAFTTDKKLIKYLHRKWISDKTQLRTKILITQVLKIWLKVDEGQDFKSPPMSKLMTDFCNEIAKESDKKLAQAAKQLKELTPQKRNRKVHNSPEPISPKTSITSIVEVYPLELARQLTLIAEEFYLSISRSDFLKMYQKSDKSLQILRLLKFGRIITNITIAEILKKPTRNQTQIFEYFVDVASELEKLKNFFGVRCILRALTCQAIEQLNLDQASDEKYKLKLSQLISNNKTIIDNLDGNVLKKFGVEDNTPMIPHLQKASPFQTLITLNKQYQDYTPDGWVNWLKMTLLSKVLLDLKNPKRARYNLIKVKNIQDLIFKEAWPNADVTSILQELRKMSKCFKEKIKETNFFTEHYHNSRVDLSTFQLELSDEDWSFIIDGALKELYAEGEPIIPANTYNKGDLYCLSKGTVIGKSQHSRTVLAPRTLFGELGKDVPWTYVADTNVEVYKIPSTKIVNLFKDNPSLSAKFPFHFGNKVK